MSAPLCSAGRPLRVPGRVPGSIVELACEPIQNACVTVTIRFIPPDSSAPVVLHGYVLPAFDPVNGTGRSAADVGRMAVALAADCLVTRQYLDAAPDWEMFGFLAKRADQAARLAAGTSIR